MVTACSVIFALAQWGLPPVAIAALILLAVSIFCHVAGNAIGTRLREIGDRRESRFDVSPRRTNDGPQPHEFAPATQLGQRRSLGWVIVIATVTGTAAGGIGGGLWTWLFSNRPVGPFNVAVGVVAFAVLGGMAAFIMVGFVQVLLGALWQAMQTPPALAPDEPSADGLPRISKRPAD